MAYSEEQYQEAFFPQPDLDSKYTRGRFHGKVAIVTGGSSGIGRAVVERFSNDGAHVAMFARDAQRGEAVEGALRQKGMNVKFYQVDVSDSDRCKDAVRSVAKENGGRVHFLVNSHGVFYKSDSSTPPGIKAAAHIAEVSVEKMKEVLLGNVVGAVNTIQACYPFMKDDGKNCAIVNISSIRAYNATPCYAPYNSAKAALNMMTKCAALDLSDVGIRCNSLSPGYTWTPRIQTMFGTRENANKQTLKTTMSRSLMDASGIASVASFLCSQDAVYVDGTDIPVDCGNVAMGPEGHGQ